MDLDQEYVRRGITEAIFQAKKSLSEGGIPIGSSLYRGSDLVGAGHNKRVQMDSAILHGEMDCLQNAGRQRSYRDTVIFSTLMPCYMCAGTIVQFEIPTVVVGESRNFTGAREFMESHEISVIDLDDLECREMMEKFIRENHDLWYEDIGK
ncbi:nucleoside deaminase [Frankia sp. R43]|uniref:nucleoside deaminase n=1 Tax=Frankia sp. R43 TaxID=269536 RepID=UPI0009F95F8B